MTLHTYPDVIQGTDEWHDLRRGMVTASTVGKLLTPTLKVASNDTSRAVTLTLIAERLTGVTEDGPMTSDMWRGVETEPHARDHYSEHYAPVTEMGFMVLEETWGRLGFSPDGLVGDDGAIEIKAPRAKTHIQTILRDEVPATYIPQLQAGLLVTGRDWIDYCSYHGGLPMWVIRVFPDPAWHEAIKAAVHALELNATDTLNTYRARTAGLPNTEPIKPLQEASL